jgi:CHASE2 domain-containing sensor protein
MQPSPASASRLNSSKFNKLRIRILLVLVALMFSYAGYWFWLEKFETWNSQIIDRLLILKANVNPSDQIEKNSIAHVDANFYVNRSHHARVIDNLSAMKVSALLIDYIFADHVGEEDDRPLIEATKKAGRVYFGLAFDSLSRQYSGFHEVLGPEASRYLDQSKWQLPMQAGSDSFYTGTNPKITFPDLAFASQGLGFLNITADQDGILRRLPLMVHFRGAYYPSLSLRVVCDYLNVSPKDIIVEPGKAIILKQVRNPNASSGHDIVIPIDDRGTFLINYSSSYEPTRHYSYREILQASEDAAKLAKLRNELSGKIVILSEAVEEGFLIRPNKAGMRLSSGQIHSIVLQNILTRSFLIISKGSFRNLDVLYRSHNADHPSFLVRAVLIDAIITDSHRSDGDLLPIGHFFPHLFQCNIPIRSPLDRPDIGVEFLADIHRY